jgi:hypothetical protein
MIPTEETMDRSHTSRPVASRPAQARSRGLLLVAVATGALLAGAPPSAKAGSPEPIQLELVRPQAKQKRTSTRRVSTPKPHAPTQTTTESVRLEGTIRVSRDGVFRLGNDVLMMGTQVRALSDDRGRMLKPSAWDGRDVTVFGSRTGRGVRVSLVIDHGQPGSTGLPMAAPLPPNARPSDSDPQVGELSDATPR